MAVALKREENVVVCSFGAKAPLRLEERLSTWGLTVLGIGLRSESVGASRGIL